MALLGNETNTDLRAAGLKVTVPRSKILALFQKNNTQAQRHWSAEEVHLALVKDDLDVGLATVYRVLTQFEQAGLLKRGHFEAGRTVFELNEGEHHDHIVCVRCGFVAEFNDPEIEARQEAIAHNLGFKLSEHSLSLYGDCIKPHCERMPQTSLPILSPLL